MRNIAIIGFGRFGELLANILKAHGEVHIISLSGHSGEFPLINYEELSGMDWVIPAVPISALEETLKKAAPHLRAGALLMDVCSVKVYPCQWLQESVPANVELMGTHPMFGPDSAKNGLKGLQMVLCPLRVSPETYESVRSLFAGLGLTIVETSPEEHDRQAANCLALVHYLGRGLQQMGLGRQAVTTVGFERLLAVNETVSNDTWQLFFDMQTYNPFAKEVRQQLREALATLERKITEKEG
jgi:prephenate dehydrogenase